MPLESLQQGSKLDVRKLSVEAVDFSGLEKDIIESTDIEPGDFDLFSMELRKLIEHKQIYYFCGIANFLKLTFPEKVKSSRIFKDNKLAKDIIEYNKDCTIDSNLLNNLLTLKQISPQEYTKYIEDNRILEKTIKLLKEYRENLGKMAGHSSIAAGAKLLFPEKVDEFQFDDDVKTYFLELIKLEINDFQFQIAEIAKFRILFPEEFKKMDISKKPFNIDKEAWSHRLQEIRDKCTDLDINHKDNLIRQLKWQAIIYAKDIKIGPNGMELIFDETDSTDINSSSVPLTKQF